MGLLLVWLTPLVCKKLKLTKTHATRSVLLRISRSKFSTNTLTTFTFITSGLRTVTAVCLRKLAERATSGTVMILKMCGLVLRCLSFVNNSSNSCM